MPKSLADGMCKDISSGVNMDDEEDDYPSKKDNLNNDPKVIDDGSDGGNSNPIDDPIDDPVTDPDPKTDVNNPMGSYNQPCSVEGEKKIDVVFGMEAPLICNIAMTLTCDEGEWTMDEASAEEMLKCDQEGAKSVVMGLPVICKDGQWDLDEDSMDWGDYGDWGDEEIIVD